MSNRLHSFFVEAGNRIANFKPEAGIEIELKTLTELTAMIRGGEFDHQLHIGTVLQASGIVWALVSASMAIVLPGVSLMSTPVMWT